MNNLETVFDLPAWADWMIASCWIVVAVVQGVRLRLLGFTSDRALQLAGWSVLGGWWLARLAVVGDLRVSAISVIGVLLIALSAVISAMRQFQIWRADVRCFQDPSQRCYRSDRVRMVLLRDP